jgi:hypothetical protein
MTSAQSVMGEGSGVAACARSMKGNPAARKIIRDAELTIFLSGWVTS